MPRTAGDIQTELDVWYAARTAAAAGQSITIATSAGSRTITHHDLTEISKVITQLERELASVDASLEGNPHNFSLGNFNHDENP